MKQGAFSGSGRAHDGNELPAPDLKIDAIEHHKLFSRHGKRFREIDDLDHGRKVPLHHCIIGSLPISMCNEPMGNDSIP
jgi:hypothetical protein